MAGVSRFGSSGVSAVGGAQLRPPFLDRLVITASGGGSDAAEPAEPAKYTVPSTPAEIHGSDAKSAVPPVHTVRPGIIAWIHRRPPSNDAPIRSVRAPKPKSCCQTPTMLCGRAGLTVIAGSISPPVTFSPSLTAPGQPAGNGLGPDSARDRKSTRLNSSHVEISYAVFCLKK